MRLVHGFHCPDYDSNMEDNIKTAPEFGGRSTYQFYAFQAIFQFMPNFRTALDIGAHIGAWSHVMSRCFNGVTAFEPVASHAECFRKNVTAANVNLHQVALGDRAMDAEMATKPKVSLKARIFSGEEGVKRFPTQVRTLDSFAITEPIDFIKMDCEGYELLVLRGGETTIRTNKPLMLVEQKPLNCERYGFGDTDGVSLLEQWGATVLWSRHGDYCMGWPR